MKRFAILAACLSLSACAAIGLAPVQSPAQKPGADDTRPKARPDADAAARPVPAGARTAEAFDTTTEAEREAAADAAAAPAAAGPLGTTIVSLGDPTEQGFWLKTPLVRAVRQGRVVYGANGKAVAVELRPSGTERGSGSQISLAAMRVLEAPLTELIEVEVFPG